MYTLNKIKPTLPKSSLHNLHLKLLGFHSLILILNTNRASNLPFSSGREFHIADAKISIFLPLRTLSTEGTIDIIDSLVHIDSVVDIIN